MDVDVRAVVTRKERRQFIQLPYTLNKQVALWIPPLRISQEEILGDRNPFWKKNIHRFFLAYRGKQCVGRIASFVNLDHERHFGKQEGFFGFLEAVDDPRVFELLLQSAEQFLQAQGCRTSIGPFNPSIHHELGILVEGFDDPAYYMLSYNMPYYDPYVQACSYQKLKDFCSYTLQTRDFHRNEKLLRVKAMLEQKHALTMRIPDLKNFTQELKIFHEIYNNAFIGHWGFSPMHWEDFQFLGKDMKLILDKEMILIVEKDQEPVGFLLAIPNLNEVLAKIKNGRLIPFGIFQFLALRKTIKSLRVITVAIKKEYQHLGIGSLLYPEIAHRSRLHGYENSELSWVVEDNSQMNKIILTTGAKVYKKYRLYIKSL